MDVAAVKMVLLWCFVINTLIVTVWFATVALRWEWPYRISAKTFNISLERTYEMSFGALVIYKTLNIVFFLVPFLALSIVKA
jgi:hypothetical protein